MARHSSGQSNFKLSKNLTIALITVLVISALILWWVFSNRSDDSTNQADGSTSPTTSTAEDCLQGDLTLPVGGDPAAVEAAVAEFNASTTITRDFCVTAEPVSAGTPAAAYLFAGSRAEAAAALSETGAVAAGSQDTWPQVSSVPAGVAVSEGATVDLDGVVFPVASTPTISAAVALALASGDQDAAAAAVAEDAETTSEIAAGAPAFATLESDELPSGYSFESVEGAEIPVWAISTTTNEEITEDQARAAADFASALGTDTPVNDAELISILERAQTDNAEEPAPVVVSQPADTLIVLDTSTNMDKVVDGTQESYHTMTSNILIELAKETGGLGNQVALNNYSSPLNPGVTRGWRPNVSFPDQSGGSNAAGAIARFGTGGVPLTRAAAVSAASIGAEHAAATGREVRVVLVTSGSASDYSDEAFLADIEAAAGDKVSLHVVHVGNGEVDRTLTGFAMANGGSAVTATTAQEVNDTLRAAFGF